MTPISSRETLDVMRLALLVLLASTHLAHADDRETCDGGFVMRSPSGGDICAETARLQFWENQGYTFVTNAQRGREIAERTEPKAESSGVPVNAILIGAVVLCAIGYFIARRRGG